MKHDNSQSPHISRKYQKELEKIREEVKKGDCSTLRECLILFEDLWSVKSRNFADAENPSPNLLFSNKSMKKIGKLAHDDPEQYLHVMKKIKQIQTNPSHYKPLRGDLHGARRVHIGDFVLVYQLDKENIVIHDYDHHDRIYE